MRNRRVNILSGGGGSRSTGKSCALDTNVILNLIQDLTNVTVKKNCHREGVSPWRSRQKSSVLDWIATRSTTARNDAGGRAGFLFGWSLKSHVQPLWMALSAFTMAEILLSLTIIGVVAAITLPSLTGNINERTWNTQRKALYARMSQAVALMPALNGYGVLKEETDSAGSTSIVDTAAETFVTAGLSKVLKINNICDNEHLADCGIPKTFINLKGSKVDVPEDLVALNSFFTSGSMINGDFFISYSQQNTKAVAFETVNGESLITYYNPKCRYRVDRSSAGFSQPDMCANFIYDLNGTKGPNTVGKDVGFITVMYPADSSVFMPMPYTKTAGYATSKNANKLCQTIFGDDARLPNRNELAAVAFNSLLTGEYSANDSYWTSTPTGAFNNKGYYVYNIKSGLYRTDYGPDTPIPIICIKK